MLVLQKPKVSPRAHQGLALGLVAHIKPVLILLAPERRSNGRQVAGIKLLEMLRRNVKRLNLKKPVLLLLEQLHLDLALQAQQIQPLVHRPALVHRREEEVLPELNVGPREGRNDGLLLGRRGGGGAYLQLQLNLLLQLLRSLPPFRHEAARELRHLSLPLVPVGSGGVFHWLGGDLAQARGIYALPQGKVYSFFSQNRFKTIFPI